MRKLLPLSLLALAVAGCSGGDDGVDTKAVEKDREPFAAAVKRSGGKWENLNDAEKKLFLDRGHGSEAAAKTVFGMMSGGPNVGPQKKP